MSAISTYDENYILGTHVVRNDQISWESECQICTRHEYFHSSYCY